MYPYIELGGLKIYMTGIGIVLSIIMFIVLMSFYTKRFGLNFWKFFNWLPVFLVLPYVLGGYFSYIIQYKDFLPINAIDIIRIITPYWYNFHFIWVSIGLIIALLLFLKTVSIKAEKYKRIDVFFYSFILSVVVLGFFLTLWDNFIWRDTKSMIWISALKADSELFKSNKVHPVGIYLSFVSIFTFWFTFFANYVFKKQGIWIIWFVVFLFLINFVFIFQQYPRHLVRSFGDFILDVKNYSTVIFIIFILFYYFRLNSKK